MEFLGEIYNQLSSFFYTKIGMILILVFATILFRYVYKNLIRVSRKLKIPITQFQKIGLNGLFFGNMGGTVAVWLNKFGLDKLEFTIFGINLSVFEIFSMITFAYMVLLLNKRLKLI